MRQFLLTMAGVFAGLVLFFIGVPFLILSLIASAAHPAATPAKTVLALDLRRAMTDQEPDGVLPFTNRGLAVMSVVQALHRAEGDGRVKALFVRLPEGGMEPGEADELRLAFKHFRESGKPIIAHSQGLYSSGAIASTYMLGAAADQFWMQPGAPFQVTGMSMSDVFFKRFFDKYGVTADFEQRKEFKNAVNGYLYDNYTPAHREAETGWMTSVYDSATDAAAADRKKAPAQLRAVLEAGPYDAADAKTKGLIDHVGQVPEAEEAAIIQGGDGAKVVSVDDYISANKTVEASTVGQPVVAVVNAEGAIMTGPNEASFGAENANSDAIAGALQAAAKDSAVKAIVFRVSSPGGSDTASEQILAAVRAAKAQKPVVVSMGTYGASGGYWISSQASSIVAEPTTLTGSIGVFGGKFALGPALARFGVDLHDINVGGEYAGADSATQDFTPQQKAAFAAEIDRVYDGFIGRVAEGRHLSPDKVREIAKGRVWTGVDAKKWGLVDELGGFYQAVERAKVLAHLEGQTVRLKTVSIRRSPFDALAKAFGVDSTSLQTMATAARLFSDPRAQGLVHAMDQERLRAQGADVLAETPRF
ncbi:signal peptide peptidase SppA [Phenylobacterium montanum]|uniref:Signal peptide peptidase SppA n=1 Tax=Phenylobacterium montanum TaxID=2823693 RepID=A0A975FXN2_9CAUL|nr:signal peptide peptidase SppA [Caulobacter sp. S6]QUD87124.1 signal peptide peptidase SppA [Caulobacter sp. S6]